MEKYIILDLERQEIINDFDDYYRAKEFILIAMEREMDTSSWYIYERKEF